MNKRFPVVYFLPILAIILLLVWYHIDSPVDSPEERVNTKAKTHVDYKTIMSNLNIRQVAADDKNLTEILRKYYIEPPATDPYKLAKPEIENPSPGQTQFVDKLLNNKTNGFYVDCGAHDGEHLSNSLFLERFRNWRGILIEPNPHSYDRIRKKKRKAFTLNACLSVKNFPVVEKFYTGETAVFGRILNEPAVVKMGSKIKQKELIQAQCFPLYSILLALNQLHVDYFSLDVEGAEPGVLDTIPWDKVDIRVFSIEHNKWPGGKDSLKSYMQSKGYEFMTQIKVNVAPDLIFMKK